MCREHFTECRILTEQTGSAHTHSPVMFVDITQQTTFLFFLLGRRCPDVLATIILSYCVFSTNVPSCISCRCNYLLPDGTRCAEDYSNDCHRCSHYDCSKKIGSGELCQSHIEYACGVDGCTNWNHHCTVHGCQNCARRVQAGSPLCPGCACACCGPLTPYTHDKHDCDVCNDWTSSQDLLDQVADTRQFELMTRRTNGHLHQVYYRFILDDIPTPIHVCPRCIVQGACVINAVIGPVKCTHPKCWPPEDTFFGILM